MTTAAQTELTVAPERAPVAQSAPLVPQPQYVTNFEGMGAEPLPESVRKVLAEPVNPEEVEIKPDGICYMPGFYWRRQLTKAFGAGGWGLAPRTPARVMGNIVIWDGVLIGLKRVLATAVGECQYHATNQNMTYATCVEGAKTDALGRCCKDLSMALELHDPKWRRWWLAEYAEQYTGRKKKDGQWVEAKLWRLKSGRRADPVEQARGAGGVVDIGEREKEDDIRDKIGAGQARAGNPTPANDDGSAPSTEALNAIADRLKALKMKRDPIKRWLHSLFGVEALGALSANQADCAYTLLLALEPGYLDPDSVASNARYQAILDEFKRAGKL